MGLQDLKIVDDKRGQLTGKFKGSRLTLLKFSHRDERARKIMLFLCDCGNQKKIRLDHVQGGLVKSCGCLTKERKHDLEQLKRMREMPSRLENLRKVKKETISPNKGKIRIEDPIGSGKYRFVKYNELASMYYGVDVESF